MGLPSVVMRETGDSANKGSGIPAGVILLPSRRSTLRRFALANDDGTRPMLFPLRLSSLTWI